MKINSINFKRLVLYSSHLKLKKDTEEPKIIMIGLKSKRSERAILKIFWRTSSMFKKHQNLLISFGKIDISNLQTDFIKEFLYTR